VKGLPLVSLFMFLGPSLRIKLAAYGDEQDSYCCDFVSQFQYVRPPLINSQAHPLSFRYLFYLRQQATVRHVT